MSDQVPSSIKAEKIKKQKPKKPWLETKRQQLLDFFIKRRKMRQSKDGKHSQLRQVKVDTQQLPRLPLENFHFVKNHISTTKYTFWSFLPKSLLVQFFRISNVYFLITAILCYIPGFSPLAGYTAVAPLVFVLLMSMMREGYEDLKRRRNDRLTNNKVCKVLRDPIRSTSNNFDNAQTLQNLKQKDLSYFQQYFKETLWQDVKCGDIILIQDGEHFPADIVLLMSSADNGECFVQTSSLDGERALKHKQCLIPIQSAIETYGLHNFQAQFHCENPTKSLYEFNAFMESEQFPEYGTIQLHQESKRRTLTLDNKQLGLRGSNLANTDWILGAVVYTGKDTKLMLNQGQSRFKQSKIEKVVNMICIYLIIIQAVLCIIMSINSGFFTTKYAQLSADGLMRKAEYLFYTYIDSNNSTNINDYSSTVIGVETYGCYYILLNTIIPISLVVSLEFVKLIQTPFIASDIKMYDEESMKQAQPMSMTLHEELAAVKYIFADKTGTLTANIMQFKACTIGSVCYDEEYKEEDYEYEIEEESLDGILDDDQRNALIQPQQLTQDGQIMAEVYQKVKQEVGFPFNKQGEESKMNKRRNSVTKIVWNFSESVQILKGLLETRKQFLNEETNLGKTKDSGPEFVLRKQNEYLNQFWLNVALCHDVIATTQGESNQLAYQGSSPDEITLLDAAKEIGYMFIDRNSDSMKIEVFGKPKNYKLLQKLEFNSDRKKMSVIVQDVETGFIILYTKGADLAIFERLSVDIEQHFLEATKEDLIKFSTKGFRTLCFAMRVLSEQYYNDWVERYENAKLEMIKLGVNKKVQKDEISIIDKLQNEIESELFLLGATALEDKLQEGVPEAIDDFHQAGIKVWMLTGDKLETAENIGFSSKMFTEKMYIFKLQTNDKKATRQRLQQIETKINEIEKQHAMPIIGTQFILNPNAGADFEQIREINQQTGDMGEARNIIRALEEFRHESRASEYTLNDSWARRPALKRKVRKRLEEIVPDKNAIIDTIVNENQLFSKSNGDQFKYIPQSFDMRSKQYIVRGSNIYRSAISMKGKDSDKTIIDNEDTFGILVEGQTLAFILDSDSMRHKFLKILGKCSAVIVCRASPSQKGQVVQMVKDSEPETVTLAIGDGANDVNMIQKAHIGIGIFGKEGYQAAGNSDYAIAQFRHLRRLMFVHGRWSGIRLSNFMLFFFHKNVVFTLPQFWFGWYCGYSGQTFYDDGYLTMFNTLVTALAICTIAVSDQDINIDYPKTATVIDFFLPQIYRDTQIHDLFTKKKFIGWTIISTLQSVFIFAASVIAYNFFMFDAGKMQDLWAMSTCAYFGIVLIHYLFIFAFTKNWTLWIIFMYSISVILFCPFFIFIYDFLPNTYVQKELIEIVFSSVLFWIVILLIQAVCILPVMLYYIIQSLLFPKLKDLILQDRVDFVYVMRQCDPLKSKQAHDLFKQKQQAQLLQWQQEYNNFNISKVDHNNSQLNCSQHNDGQDTPLKNKSVIANDFGTHLKIPNQTLNENCSPTIRVSNGGFNSQSRKGLSASKNNTITLVNMNNPITQNYEFQKSVQKNGRIEEIKEEEEIDVSQFVTLNSENMIDETSRSRENSIFEKVKTYVSGQMSFQNDKRTSKPKSDSNS